MRCPRTATTHGQSEVVGVPPDLRTALLFHLEAEPRKTVGLDVGKDVLRYRQRARSIMHSPPLVCAIRQKRSDSRLGNGTAVDRAGCRAIWHK